MVSIFGDAWGCHGYGGSEEAREPHAPPARTLEGEAAYEGRGIEVGRVE